MAPKISVIMGVFNGGHIVKNAIESVKKQKFDDWECIICDDGSTDETWEVISEFARSDNRFIPIRVKQNRGPAHARNRCIDASHGEYVAIQDADDLSMPERLAEQVAFLDNHKDVSVVGSYASLIDRRLNVWGEMKPKDVPQQADWVKGPQVVHASTMMRRVDLINVGKYNEKLRKAEDYDLWIRFMSKGYKIVTMPMMLYAIHWDAYDYTRKRMRHRWDELAVCFRAWQMPGTPFYYVFYLLKPLVTGMLPSKILHWYHMRTFKTGYTNVNKGPET